MNKKYEQTHEIGLSSLETRLSELHDTIPESFEPGSAYVRSGDILEKLLYRDVSHEKQQGETSTYLVYQRKSVPHAEDDEIESRGTSVRETGEPPSNLELYILPGDDELIGIAENEASPGFFDVHDEFAELPPYLPAALENMTRMLAEYEMPIHLQQPEQE